MIKDNDNIKSLLAYMRKIYNIIEIESLVIDKMTMLTKIIIGTKRPDMH